MSRSKPRKSKSRLPNPGEAHPDDADRDADFPGRPLAPRPAEQILIDALGDVPPGRILCTSLGRGQFAAAAAQADASSHVSCCFLDLYPLEQTRLQHADPPANLLLECAADFPDGPFDAVAFPVSASGEA